MSVLPIELARMWTGSKTIESPLLNRLGAQVVRAIAAQAAYQLRPWSADSATGELASKLREEGALILPDFLSENDFQVLRQECVRFLDDSQASKAVHRHGCTTVEHVDILSANAATYPALFGYLQNSKMQTLAEAAEKRHIDFLSGCRLVERVTQGQGEHDPETDLHSDIFFGTHKCWLYLDDVTPESGPLVFVKGSHKITADRLKYLYADSRARSPRITAEEVRERGLEETVITCRANTFVMANVCGYHRRLPGRPGQVRRAVLLGFRYNPFLPGLLGDTDGLRRRYPRAFSALRAAANVGRSNH